MAGVKICLVGASALGCHLDDFGTKTDDLDLTLAVDVANLASQMEVVIDAIDLTTDDQIVAICTRGRSRQRISILEVPVPDPRPTGWDWVDAYRRWTGDR